MKVLALDHGTARTGVAISDPTGTIARPLEVIRRIESRAGERALDEVIAREGPERIVVGDPRHLSGAAGAQADAARSFAERLGRRVDVPVELLDERLSTVEARRRAAEAGSSSAIDSLAACVLLDAYLASVA